MENKGNLAKAIIQVMKKVNGIEKSMTVGSGSYSYKGVPDEAVKAIYKEAMVEAGLCILPLDIDPTTTISEWEESYNGNVKRRQSVFTEVKTKYLLIHSESGESQIISGLGHGTDSSDKGAGKATTYALKYTLLYLFLTPTGKIDDTDRLHSKDAPKKPPTTQKPKNPSEKKKPQLKLTKEQFDKTLKGTPEQIVNVLLSFITTKAQNIKLNAILDKLKEDATEKKDAKSPEKKDPEPEDGNNKRQPAISLKQFEEAKKMEPLDIIVVLEKYRMDPEKRKELEQLSNTDT